MGGGLWEGGWLVYSAPPFLDINSQAEAMSEKPQIEIRNDHFFLSYLPVLFPDLYWGTSETLLSIIAICVHVSQARGSLKVGTSFGVCVLVCVCLCVCILYHAHHSFLPFGNDP